MTSHLEKLRERNRSVRAGKFQYEDAEWMRAAYWERNLTLRQIAREAECSLRTVARWMQTHGIDTDSTRRPDTPKGELNPNWRGGVNYVCPKCGGPKAFKSKACIGCLDISGSSNYRWLGDNAGYVTVHIRVSAARGRAKTHPCALCGAREAQHWAYDHMDPNEKIGPDKPGRPDRPFSLDLNHYLPMCVACHKRYDMGVISEAA